MVSRVGFRGVPVHGAGGAYNLLCERPEAELFQPADGVELFGAVQAAAGHAVVPLLGRFAAVLFQVDRPLALPDAAESDPKLLHVQRDPDLPAADDLRGAGPEDRAGRLQLLFKIVVLLPAVQVRVQAGLLAGGRAAAAANGGQGGERERKKRHRRHRPDGVAQKPEGNHDQADRDPELRPARVQHGLRTVPVPRRDEGEAEHNCRPHLLQLRAVKPVPERSRLRRIRSYRVQSGGTAGVVDLRLLRILGYKTHRSKN